MLLAVVSFVPHMEHEEGELVRAAQDYLTALVKNGQVQDNYVTGWIDGIYTAYVSVTHRDAYRTDVSSVYVKAAEAEVRLQYGTSPEWAVLDDDSSLPVPQMSSAGYLYLMTHAFHAGSPVWHGAKGTSLPLSLLPITDQLKEDLYDWSLLGRSYDQIWTIGGPLAQRAWDELSNWNSPFQEEAQRLATTLTAQTELPSYVYLWNDFPETSSGSQSGQRCPGCDQDWDTDESQIPSREPFRKFHFRCDRCRIVTHEPQRPWGEQLRSEQPRGEQPLSPSESGQDGPSVDGVQDSTDDGPSQKATTSEDALATGTDSSATAASDSAEQNGDGPSSQAAHE